MVIAALNYLAGFRCLAAACPDNCCRDWKITADYRFYDRFRRRCREAGTYSRHFRGRFRKLADGNRLQVILRLDETGKCTFLHRDGLCDLRRIYGEEYLPDACALFPRITTRINKRLEVSASFACPEIGRRGLFLASGIRLELSAAALTRPVAMTSWDLDDSGAYLVLRDCCLAILQSRRLSIEDRVILLGKLLAELDETKLFNLDRLGRVWVAYERTGRSGGWRPREEPLVELQLAVVENLLRLRFNYVLDCTESHDFLSRAAAWASGRGSAAAERYLNAYHRRLRPALVRLGPVLENFLVNAVFRNHFLLPGLPYRDHFTDLINRFLLFRFLLVRLAAGDEPSPENVTAVARIFSRVLDHHPPFLQQARRYLQSFPAETVPLILLL